MSFADRLKQARIDAGLKQSELAEKIQLSKGAISNYEVGVSFPNTDILYKLFEVLNVTPNFLFQDDVDIKDVNISLEERTLLDVYKDLNDDGKQKVHHYAKDLLGNPQYSIKTKSILYSNIKPVQKNRHIYYDIPVSAGTGQPLDVSTAVMVELEIEPPWGTNYILRIAGDSMEPDYCDGDYIYVKRVDKINYNDIGIFTYQGSVYMKQYTPQGLKSLNSNYALISANNDIRCLGKVLGVVEGDIKIIK